MFRKLLALCCVILVGSSIPAADAQCPNCGFEVAFWISGDLFDLNSGACGLVSDNVELLADVDQLLKNSSCKSSCLVI